MSDPDPPQGAVGTKPTQADIARDWGVARSYVGQMVKKKGLDLSKILTLEDARKWRLANSVNGIGFRSKKPTPDPSLPPPLVVAQPQPVVAPASHTPVMVGDLDLSQMENSVRGCVEVEAEALRMVKDAQNKNLDEHLGIRISAHNKATSGRFAAQEAYVKLLEKKKVLITADYARELLRRAWLPFVTKLRAMSKRAAMRANPTDDVHAEKVISEEVESILEEVRNEFFPQ